MKRILGIAASAFILVSAAAAHADAVSDLQSTYRAQAKADFSVPAGQRMWTRGFQAPDGRQRRCSDCHTQNLRQPGKHVRTGKVISPMAPSINAQRLTDPVKIEKWFTRNCKWTLGRACTAQEKGDFLSFINSQ